MRLQYVTTLYQYIVTEEDWSVAFVETFEHFLYRTIVSILRPLYTFDSSYMIYSYTSTAESN